MNAARFIFSRGRRRWRWGVVGLLAAPLLLWGIFFLAVALLPFPQNTGTPPMPGTWLEDRTGVPLAALVGPDEQWHIPLTRAEISPHLLQAIVAVEDRRFYAHAGVDWRSAAVAAWQNAKSGRIVRGASTITMQVWRLREPQPRSWWAKLEQAFRAAQLERHAGKDQILQEYINRAPFGGNLVGAGAASWRYFGRPCRELSLGQAALLAGLPQSPQRFRPDRFPDAAARRRAFVLDRMLACGMITPQQRDEAVREPLDAGWYPLPQARDHGLPADGAFPTLTALAEERPRSTLRTTLDAALQRQLYQAAAAHVRILDPGVSAAVMLLDTQTAECLAAVSLSSEAADVDLTRRPRSTGSTLKPFIYAAAFEAGQYAPTSVLEDAPHAWAGYLPANFDRQFRGRLTAAEALADSRNIPAMQVLAKVGLDRTTGIMEAAGLRSLGRAPAASYGLALAIGGAEASPLQLVEAYATLGRGGVHRPVTLVRTPAAAAPATHANVLPDWVCYQTLNALADADRTRAVCPDAADTHVAWKTGTSSGFRDAWCAAVTHQYTLVVWLGNAAGHPVPGLTGISAAAPLALRLVAALEAGHAGPQDPWPTGASPYVSENETRRAALQRVPPLSLVSPAPDQEIILQPEEPAAQQRVTLRSAGGTGLQWWFVDDEPVGQAPAGQALFWPPQPGPHTLRVVDAAGRTAQISLRVRTH